MAKFVRNITGEDASQGVTEPTTVIVESLTSVSSSTCLVAIEDLVQTLIIPFLFLFYLFSYHVFKLTMFIFTVIVISFFIPCSTQIFVIILIP